MLEQVSGKLGLMGTDCHRIGRCRVRIIEDYYRSTKIIGSVVPGRNPDMPGSLLANMRWGEERDSAEIRAIEKVKLAEEVRNQKRQEAQMLSEVLLDSEVKLGQLFDKIPTNQGKRTDIELIKYLERVRNYIPRYDLRAELGLRNPSNLGEKSNDLVVSSRQKHNGMSWSADGSFALASVCAASANGEIINWVQSSSLSFKFVQKSA